jgi:hypothetical protein
MFRTAKSDQKFSRRGVVLVTPIPGKEGSKMSFRPSLHPSEKELPERLSGVFRHKNTAASEYEETR